MRNSAKGSGEKRRREELDIKQTIPLPMLDSSVFMLDCSMPDKNVVKGKILLCKLLSYETFTKGIQGLISIDDSSLNISFLFPIPFIVISSLDGLNLLNYINNTK
ncbi:hypothetical protein ZIOFF_003698 [Zingiber officinale]|uniref:Uncharacterized protein n=1 Tax=Zingiber officinale TaxID=94328 RepID=A0A8J5LTP3_ZINOF|nr:hypothetical protein ZIOFF_003698 [Zingiber officinale]